MTLAAAKRARGGDEERKKKKKKKRVSRMVHRFTKGSYGIIAEEAAACHV